MTDPTKLPILPVRQTRRLLLRRPTLADRDFVVDLFARPELVAHRPHPVPDTVDASAARLERDTDH